MSTGWNNPQAACPPARSSHVDVPGSRHLGSIRYTPHMRHRRRTGCVLSVLASKIQTWSPMASASRARRYCSESSRTALPEFSYPNRLRCGAGPTRQRLGCDSSATGRQRHRLYQYGIRHERQISGAAQRDRTAHGASGVLRRSKPLLSARKRHRAPLPRTPATGVILFES